jgi:deoxyribodipyrimidine photolyase-related protein
MDALLILGNQLFLNSHFPKVDKKKTIVFMREDSELCTHFKYHKHKIIFFLSAMRKYAKSLKDEGYTVHYEHLQKDKKKYQDAFSLFLESNKITKLYYFEVEDKFFEIQLQKTLKRLSKVQSEKIESPMFLTSRDRFAEYLKKTKKPFMKTFYESQRKRFKILVTSEGKPIGDRWSFDEENRLSLPKNYTPPVIEKYKMDKIDLEVAALVDLHFKTHIGESSHFWLPTDRKGVEKWLDLFLEERLAFFGPYEDALSKDFPFINHSVLAPFLNIGLLTPELIIKKTLKVAQQKKLSISSVEGFIRQIIGWREFIRGIYQNFSEKQETANFFNHQRKLKDSWYEGTTGIEPLDDVILKTKRYAYAHHIERLMVVGSLMLLLEIHPQEAHRWFMEMFIDSSDWVMGPNVYGMALFSDGGIFATKPYFCGSNYYKKMGPYKTGDWQDGVDGLYWGFIDRRREFFLKNPRMSMMVRTFDKMDSAKKSRILKAAEKLKNKITSDELKK